MKPPFTISPQIIELLTQITYQLGQAQATGLNPPPPQLRKSNKIKTIHSTLAIEGNSLTLNQITAVLEGKKVLGKESEILEVKNALALYAHVEELQSQSISDFLKAHKILMTGLITSAGQFRKENVGVLKGSKVSHIAPQHKLVPELTEKLFSWYKTDTSTHPLIKSCIVHYEIEFIHPFKDGNGRIGRFWQNLILTGYNPLFKYLSVESLIKLKQSDYYSILEKSDNNGDSTPFIEFILQILLESLQSFTQETPVSLNNIIQRLAIAKAHFNKNIFSKRDYHKLIPQISSATASRDLKSWREQKLISSSGSANQTKYFFIS